VAHVTGGVDTHADAHVAAALDPIGGLLGVQEFPATPAGHARLLGWLGGFGTVCLAGIEGTGSYGAGLARHVTAGGIRVVEVDRSPGPPPGGQVRPSRCGQRGAGCSVGPRPRPPEGRRDGAVEAIRTMMVAKRSARAERTRRSTRPGPSS
jgi:transposase